VLNRDAKSDRGTECLDGTDSERSPRGPTSVGGTIGHGRPLTLSGAITTTWWIIRGEVDGSGAHLPEEDLMPTRIRITPVANALVQEGMPAHAPKEF